MALRGHANIQGATDIATLYDLLPGYLPMPSALRDEQTLAEYLKTQHEADRLVVERAEVHDLAAQSVVRRRRDERRTTTASNICRRLIGDHSTLPTQIAMKDGVVKGYFVIGQNPASSGLNAELARAALERLDWLVVLDAYETETASFWRREGADPATIATECFFIPTATVLEKEGTMTNTNRLLQWHDKAVDPAGDAISDLAFIHRLGARLKELYAGSTDPKDRAAARPDVGLRARRRARAGARRAVGAQGAARDQRLSTSSRERRATSARKSRRSPSSRTTVRPPAGGWIYSGVCPDKATNRARNRRKATGSRRSTGASRGPRTGACSTTAPRPTRTASRGASARNTSGGT